MRVLLLLLLAVQQGSPLIHVPAKVGAMTMLCSQQ